MKKFAILLFSFCIFSINCFAQSIQSMEFQRQEMSDILLALGEYSGVTILPDETITGTVSFYFSESSLMDALEIFSNTYNLFYEKDGNIIKVSKIYSTFDKTSGNISIKAHDVPLSLIIKNISNKINKTILYDTLPQTALSLDIADLTVDEVLNICIKKYPEFEVEQNESYYYIKKIETNNNSKKISTKDVLTKNNDLYTLKLEKAVPWN